MTNVYAPTDLPVDTTPEEIAQLRATHPNHTFVVGSRKSQLALVQTEHVRQTLQQLPGATRYLPLTTMTTTGDHILDMPLAQIGEKSLFTKELEFALLNSSVDLVVHSLKDLPTALPERLGIGAVLIREDPRDAVVLRKDLVETGELAERMASDGLSALPAGSVIGTSSVRRRAQLRHAYPHLEFRDVRGNLNTRLRKLDTLRIDENDQQSEFVYTALILAAAGLHRLGWQQRTTAYLSADVCLHAVGQGALAVECRQDDPRTQQLLQQLEHAGTRVCTEAERAVMRTLEGGCSIPIGVSTSLTTPSLQPISPPDYPALADTTLKLQAVVVSVDGASRVFGERSLLLTRPAHIEDDQLAESLRAQAAGLGRELAEEMKQRGATAILAAIHH